jgi:hypothetical protein
MKKFDKLIAYSIAFFIVSCGTDPQEAIVDHWVIDLEAVNEEIRNHGRIGAYEFKEDGTMNVYNDGRIMASATYTMATDGKSFVINSPTGEGVMSFQIVSLSPRSLVLIPIERNRASKDTLYFKPKQ